MYTKILSSFIIIICFMGCTHKADDVTFDDKRTSVIDESKLVLMRNPANLQFVSDSVVAVTNSHQKLSVYNYYSGKNLQNFSLDKFDFDSLISLTYRKKYDGIKTYKYDKGFELNGDNYQLINYYYTNKTYYVFISLLAGVNDLKDSSAIVKARNSEASKNLDNAAKAAPITVYDYVNFMFTLDDRFLIKDVAPMYAEYEIRKQDYFAYFHKNFAVEKDYIYVPVAKTSDNINLQEKVDDHKNNFAFVKINLHDQSNMQFIVDYNDLDFSDYRMQDYFDACCTYASSGDDLLACTGKEIINIQTRQKLFAKENLNKDEWIDNFYKKEGHLLFLSTYTKSHLKSITISGHVCPVDSTTESHLKVFDTKANKIIIDKKLPAVFVGMLSKDKILNTTYDKKNYYFDYIGYHEK